ncbi:LLM class flavin-dependent oxidoreductase [Mycolicibacterium sediminis]|uniref:N5,N10-methylene tetrahydromethanopterin reductase n=1 Tax=Mycolicibacterium sediminis TaxID=1286180 RepID=A0A7I7QWR1_9MYCO|nr:LLM class flavin-dependent oxidoreductase [Mycolicibacterium sediminis]BBY30336.1 N5,N10-methylene tetrahydromethanopterin reductase [Mycolicibacterium sediminis]
MTDYGRDLQFGVFVTPSPDLLDNSYAIAEIADDQLDFIGVQDHPYQKHFLEAWAFMATLLARTDRVRVVPDVANLPLHNPAVLAKTAASLDVISGGRVELALGAGAFWDAIVAMGGPRRTAGEAARALREAVEVTRLMWSGERSVRYDGDFYGLHGVHPGPQPAHDMQIWLGVGGPKLLRYLGGHADGWLPSNSYFPPEALPAMSAQIDRGATDAGRDPSTIVRAYNVFGEIGDHETGDRFRGTVSQWTEDLTTLAVDTGMDTFIFGAPDDDLTQTRRFAEEVVPAVRTAVARSRGRH